MDSVFVIVELYGGLFQNVSVHKNYEDALKAFEESSGCPYDEYNEEEAINNNKEEFHLMEVPVL